MNKRAFLTLHARSSDSQESLKTRRGLLRPLTKNTGTHNYHVHSTTCEASLGTRLKGWTLQLGTVLAEKRNITDSLRDGS